jgi:2'-5' RNA ligase
MQEVAFLHLGTRRHTIIFAALITGMSSNIITIQLPAEVTDVFNKQRRQYYPAHANQVKAHLSLFYRLPADAALVTATLATMSARSPFTLQVTGLQQYPNGVAYTILSEPLQLLHQSLQAQWSSLLVRRDLQPLQAHITIMNQVTAWKAQQLHKKLLAEFQPFDIPAIGMELWRYQKGPWKLLETYPFYLVNAIHP